MPEVLCPVCRAHPNRIGPRYDSVLRCAGGCGGVGFLPSTDAPTLEGLRAALRLMRAGDDAFVELLTAREDVRGPWLAGDARSAVAAAWSAHVEAVREAAPRGR